MKCVGLQIDIVLADELSLVFMHGFVSRLSDAALIAPYNRLVLVLLVLLPCLVLVARYQITDKGTWILISFCHLANVVVLRAQVLVVVVHLVHDLVLCLNSKLLPKIVGFQPVLLCLHRMLFFLVNVLALFRNACSLPLSLFCPNVDHLFPLRIHANERCGKPFAKSVFRRATEGFLIVAFDDLACCNLLAPRR